MTMRKKKARSEEFARYREFRRELDESFTETDKALGPPDFSFLESTLPILPQTATRNYKLLFRVGAAAVFAVVVGLGGFFSVNSMNRRSAIRDEATRFTEALFGEPLFGDETALGEGDLLIGSDILSELVLPIPQNSDLLETL